jgi:hypothetical protein
MAIFLVGDLCFCYFFVFFTTFRSPSVDFSKRMTTLVYFSAFPVHYITLKEIYNMIGLYLLLSIKVTSCSNDQVNVNGLLV